MISDDDLPVRGFGAETTPSLANRVPRAMSPSSRIHRQSLQACLRRARHRVLVDTDQVPQSRHHR